MNAIVWLLIAFWAVRSNQATTTTPRQPSTTVNEECKKADLHGLIEVNCQGYRKCVDNIVVTFKCSEGQVLKKDTMLCVPKGSSGTECDYDTDCSSVADGMYPNIGDKCHSYYRCYGKINIGQFYCPASLVFNVDLQICDYPRNVEPPCGTKPHSDATANASKRLKRRSSKYNKRHTGKKY